MSDKKYLDSTGLSRLWSKIKDYISKATVSKSKGLVPVARVGSNAASSSGWYKVADSTMSSYGNTNITFLIKEGYMKSHVGILELEMRSDNTSVACWMCKWLVRSGIPSNNIRIVINGMKWTLYYKVNSGQYGCTYFIELQHRNLNGEDPTYTVNYYNTTTKETTEPASTISSSDGGTVSYANSAGTATKASQDVNGLDIVSSYLRQHGDYLNTHPENSGTILPFMNNDIAFFTERGGTVKVYYDDVEKDINISSAFDASPSYWAINPTGISEIVIELTLFKTFVWTNTIYVDSGANGWRAKNVKIEVMNTNYVEDTWVTKYNKTNATLSRNFVTFGHTPVGASNGGGGFNKVRLTFSGWVNATIFRISQIGIVNYGSLGLRETYMSKGIDDALYRSLTPATDNKYNIGSSSKRWANIYANLFNGALNGTATFTGPVKWGGNASLPESSNLLYILGIDAFADGGQTKYIKTSSMSVGKAAKLSAARNINGVAFDGSKDITLPNVTTSTDGLMVSTDKLKIDYTNVAWATCNTAAATAAKTITITGNSNWSLQAGAIIGVKFSYTNTAQNPTFNVNETGARSIWYNTGKITTGSLSYAGVANRPMFYMYDGTYFVALGWSLESNDNTIPSAYCSTAAATAAKSASCSGYVLLNNSYLHVIITQTNTSAAALTLNVNGKGAKPIYINGSASSATNYSLPAGSYIVFYNGTNYYFRTDGKLTANITGNATTATSDKNGNDITTTYVKKSGDTMTGGLDISGLGTGGQIRMYNGTGSTGYGSILRNDGTVTYILLTNAGEQTGAWNSLRPFAITNSTGKVAMQNGLSVSNGLTTNNESITSDADSTSATTGSLVSKGGIGIAKAINSGTTITAAKALKSTEGTVDLANNAAQMKYNSTDKCIDFIFN